MSENSEPDKRGGEIAITEKMIRGMIGLAKSTNAEEIVTSFCEMGKLEKWCLRLTVCRHSLCKREAALNAGTGGEKPDKP